MKRIVILLEVVCAMSLWSIETSAALINVNFGSTGTAYSGAAVVGNSGDQWNWLKSSTGNNVPLTTSSGEATTVSIDYSSAGKWSDITSSAMPFKGTPYQSLMCCFLYDSGWNATKVPLTFTLKGLAAGDYDLYLYTGVTNYRKAIYTATTNSGNDPVTIGIGPNTNLANTFINGITYGVLRATVGDDGMLVVTSKLVAGNGDEIDLSGLQLQSVPEPASIMVFSCLLGLLTRTWRKRN